MSNRLETIATEIRKDVVRMHRKGTNVGSAMSIADILAVLYFDVMNIPSPDDPHRDRFILSKGHAVSALYSALAQKGFFDRELLREYLCDGSPLMGHPSRGALPGIEVSAGSLGHALAITVGMAMAAGHDGATNRFFVLMGDGELQEGTVWEAAAQASRLHLDTVTAIVDANNLQGYGRAEDIMPIETFAEKFNAFGWHAVEVDGHDHDQLRRALGNVPAAAGKPTAVIARTIKGKGVAEMEDQLAWHYFSVPEDKLQPFLDELDANA